MNDQARVREVARPARLRVGVVGVGRAGAVLGSALDDAGHRVVAAVARSRESRGRAATWLPDATVVPDVGELLGNVDLVLLTVPDDAVAAVVERVAAEQGWPAGTLLVHTSGSLGLAALGAATAQGAVGVALHPVLSLTARPEDARRVPGAPFGVTAAPEHRPVAEALVLDMGAEPVWVPDAARPAYHAALTHGSNHLTTLVNDTLQLLRDSGVADPRTLVTPLLTGTMENALSLGDAALTGPVSRGDTSTVRRHVAVLDDVAPELLDAYAAMARRTTVRALEAGRLAPAAATALLSVLEREVVHS